VLATVEGAGRTRTLRNHQATPRPREPRTGSARALPPARGLPPVPGAQYSAGPGPDDTLTPIHALSDPPSEGFTLGVEEEYQLVDVETGELRSRARAVLESDWSGEIRPEMLQNTVEVGTRVCGSAAELRSELARLRLQAAVAAESRGLRVVAAGLHPFSHWAGQEFTAGSTYSRIRREYRRLADSQTIFGLHIHVGVAEGLDRVRLMNVARHYLPYLLALSASSPLFLGQETGYASYRAILWKRWPRTGAPPRFRDEAEYRRLVDLLIETGRIDSPGRIYWDLRAHHRYPTLEFRVADVTPRLDDGVLLATLARAVVAAAAEGVLVEPGLPEALAVPLLSENAWVAARDGVEASPVDYLTGPPRARPLREVVLELCERLEPVAARLGDAEALARGPALLERGEAAGRIRQCWSGSADDLPRLVRWLGDETVLGLGLDRRQEQRDAC
jgi:glutamate---cysteine ligase / carboxylate-amine ligase